MLFSFPQLKTFLGRLNRREKLLLLLLLQQLIYRVYARVTGQELPGHFLLTVLFILAVVLVGLYYLRLLIRPLLWSVRNRLMVTYVFIGVVPLLLILAMMASGLYLVMGQVATHLVSSEIRSRQDLIKESANALAWEIASGEAGADKDSARNFMTLIQKRLPGLHAIVLSGKTVRTFPGVEEKTIVPRWSKPGYMGVVASGQQYDLGAHVRVVRKGQIVDVFAYEPLSATLLSNLLPDLGRVQIVEFSNLQSTDSERGEGRGVVKRFNNQGKLEASAAELMVLPPALRWWDIEIKWLAFLTVQQWQSESQPISILQVVTRPTLVFNHIFKTFDLASDVSFTLKWLSLVLFGLLVAAVCISVFAGVRMTRSITRAATELDEATSKIEVGDFSHRIPIRSNDQLSKLAVSFNQMTENIQRLILEVKEKEKLDSELVIAREVQAQLFPKSMPRLDTLEVFGYCSPARVVSGDYYDVVPIDARQTALAIGDIAGKGISAALLMASIQSSLRAQLTLHGSLPSGAQSRDGTISPAQLVAMMNLQLYESTTPEKFASFFLGIYDEFSGRLIYTNAGHLPPILIRRGEAQRLEVSGMVLGVVPNNLYDQNLIQLESGDVLVGFTDGLSEPENEYGEEFGEDRLIDLLVRNHRKPLSELAALVTETVSEWARNPDLRDDMTLILARHL
jgi:phosphoserine phosphatase RsbU/P